jgi:hypothetical protein
MTSHESYIVPSGTSLDGPPELPLVVSCCPPPLTKAAIQKPPSFNVSNLNDTGHSTELVSPAASAADLPVMLER